ncbi:MAG TPA: ATP-binding protein [Terracidiphilus sp.]|nr:ATP-binding protein [Terracidiphilus sp.]
MKPWVQKALEILAESLQPPCSEHNELDWKGDLSSDSRRLTDHLTAFANHPGGGYLVFGIARDATPRSLSITEIDGIANTIANLGRDAVEPTLQIDHQGINFQGTDILLVRVPESPIKPVHRRGKSLEETCIRSGGTTRKASRQEIGHMMVHSRTPRWETAHASLLMSEREVSEVLDIDPLFKMMQKDRLANDGERLKWMQDSGFIELQPSGGAYITNLGAISVALDMTVFPALAEKSARVIVYEGTNKIKARSDVMGRRGYALTFENLFEYVSNQLPKSEVIEQALRRTVPVYPPLALREIIANALIHQDFNITGSRTTIEIFDDRIEITNPGKLLPSKTIDRIIGTVPESRNEKLASAFRLYNICEQRGSGLMRAGVEVELYGLPPIEFQEEASHFKVTLFTPKTFSQMSASERLNACYQHALLKYLSSSRMTNKSLRERLKMPEKQRSMVSRLIQEAVDEGLIAPADPRNTSKKFTEYIPAWAVER